MENVQNTTEDTLGWSGLTVAAGEVVQVRDGQGERMQRQTGGKFVVVTSDEVATAHRHRYENGSDICKIEGCDHIKRGGTADNGDPSEPNPAE